MVAKEYSLEQVPYEMQQILAGNRDENLMAIEKELQVKMYVKNDTIKVEAENSRLADLAGQVLQACLDYIDQNGVLDKEEARRLAMNPNSVHDLPSDGSQIPVLRCRNGKMIYPKTPNQAKLVEAFRENDIIFASGVAGTGKTYLAVAYAVDKLKREEISKIVLTRPAVEAGESLGFLPGDMKEKVDPYLRPLYDALNEMLGAETVERYIEKEIIEIAPLAFMRGRTLNEAIVILDEAQNTTRAQMKMFLTRMGRKCQMIINGDISQIDLIKKKDSGLIEACAILQGIDGISIQYLDNRDVVRNPLVQKIIERYAEIQE